MIGSGYAQASYKREKGHPEYDNYQETSIEGEEQDRGKRKHGGGGKKERTGGTNPHQDRKGPGLWSRLEGGGEWFEKCRKKDVNQKG